MQKKINQSIAKKRLLFIAEIGMNHNGNFDLCYELMRKAKESGADCVKFQLGWRDKKGEINIIDENIIKKLIKISQYLEIDIFFSIISPDALKLIKKFNFSAFKIASRSLSENFKMIKQIINLNKTTIISLGMWNKKIFPFGFKKNIKYLWCKSEYPLYPWNIKNFPKIFNNKSYYGYSDHTIGIDVCILAICRGAKIIEKHFTLDKSDTTIRDHALSATPDEFKAMVDIGREIEKKLLLKI